MSAADTTPAITPDRHARLEALGSKTFDLLVVGGGITGAGVARDAALRGLDVALVDKGDWAVGTSSRSSKLVHGGLRYLEHFQLGLVFESTRERAVQRKLNPNLVWPVPFLFPVYQRDKHSLFKINLGLWLYDGLALFRAHKLHRRLGRAKTLARAEGLRTEGLKGAVFYYDCGTDDARLTLANVLDAERHGAVAVSYVRFAGPVVADDRVRGAQLVDERTGTAFEARCRHLVYAGGPWTDQLPGAPGEGRLLRPTKGVHIVVPRERLALDVIVAMSALPDHRPVFAVPFGSTVYIGTTDTDYDGDLDTIRATSDDIAYLLTTTNHYFPQARLTAADVRSTWAGLRPLIRDDGTASASRTSREHEIVDDPRGITTVAGGKLTTYRAMAEEVLDQALARLGPRRDGPAPRPCSTHQRPLDPALPRFASDDGPDDPLDRILWRLHGSAMAWIRDRMATHPEEAERLVEGHDHRLAQVSWAVLGEHAERLQDVLIRRLPLFYRDADQGLGCARRVAEHMARLLDRDAAWVDAELADYEAVVELSRRGARAHDAAGGGAVAG